jgi:hypothetical protein
MEKLQQDSAMPLEQHKQDVLGALAAEKEGDQPGPAPDNNPLATELMSKAIGGSIFAAAVAVRNDLASGPGGNANKKPNSMFVGGGSPSKADHVRTSLVPMSYSEKKEAAKKTAPGKSARDADIVARSGVSRMSLTGSSMSGGKPLPIKGASVTDKIARMLKVTELKQELTVVNRAIQEPYSPGSKRLLNDLGKGVDQAEIFVQRKPDALKNTSPQFMQTMAPK